MYAFRAEIEEEAALWVWRLDSETVTEDTRLAFTRWLAEDRQHCAAFRDASRAWALLDHLVGERAAAPDR
jgi:transmembrane sensor